MSSLPHCHQPLPVSRLFRSGQILPAFMALTAAFSLVLPAHKAHAQNLNSLVALYDFDGQDASNAAPNSTGYNGTLSNVTFSNTIARDGNGYSAVFNGSTSNIATGLNVQAASMPNNTIGGWFYLISDPNNGVQQLLSDDNGSYNRGIDIDTRNSGTLQWSAFGGPSQGVVQSGVSAAPGAWHFVASTYSSASSTLTLDVDGTMTTRTGVTFNSTPNNLFIGYNPWTSGSGEYFNGYADNVFVYNSVLSNSDLNTIQSGGRNAIIGSAAAPEPGTIALLVLSGLPAIGMVARRRRKTA